MSALTSTSTEEADSYIDRKFHIREQQYIVKEVCKQYVANFIHCRFVKLANFDQSLGFQMEAIKKSLLKTLSVIQGLNIIIAYHLEWKRITRLNILKKVLKIYIFSCTTKNYYSCQSKTFGTLYILTSASNHINMTVNARSNLELSLRFDLTFELMGAFSY